MRKIVPDKFYNYIVSFYNEKILNYRNISYSQEGEDLILRRIFEDKKKGFYIDVGAHHPKRFSNTYLFYKKGWRGINIEARPGSKKLFDKIRKEDINIEAAISDVPATLTYFIFDEPALNSFDRELSIKRANETNYKLIKEIFLNTVRLSEILDKYLDSGQTIDFLSIDTEGYDLSVLKSNDWERFKPSVILCEDSEFDFDNPGKSPIFNFLVEKNYQLLAKTLNTLIFKLLES
ncbi:MAG: FkbM family methyltransferase [Ignavibacterium sp.]